MKIAIIGAADQPASMPRILLGSSGRKRRDLRL